MEATEENYYECPKCGMMITFHYNYKSQKYLSFCPYCKSQLEITKEEYEQENEVYFDKD